MPIAVLKSFGLSIGAGLVAILFLYNPAQAAPEDEDDDGIVDLIECPDPSNCRDSDGDGIPDLQDPDDDGDTIPTLVEQGPQGNFPNSDGDILPNYLDTDSDDDGIP